MREASVGHRLQKTGLILAQDRYSSELHHVSRVEIHQPPRTRTPTLGVEGLVEGLISRGEPTERCTDAGKQALSGR